MQHPLAFIRDTCGSIVRLQMFESVNGLRVEDDLIVLSIARAKSTQMRRGYRVTARGTTLHTWHLGTDQRWHRGESTSLWWSTDELHAEPRQRDDEWEQMCYRPGTDRSPMDNLARQAQGYSDA